MKTRADILLNKDASGEQSSLDALNDDVLRIVLEFLPAEFKLKYEIVCRRWNDILRKSWVGLKYLDLMQLLPFPWPTAQNVQRIVVVLQRCGSFIESVTFQGLRLDEAGTEIVLAAWAAENPVCKSMDLGAVPLSANALEKLKAFSALKSLKIEHSFLRDISEANEQDGQQYEEILADVFVHLTHLKEIDMSGSYLTSTCLSRLGPSVEILKLDYVQGIHWDNSFEIQEGLLRHALPNLKVLSLCDASVAPMSLNVLEKFTPNLSVLDISSDVSVFENFAALSKLPHLSKLFLNSIFNGMEEAGPDCIKALTGPTSLCRKTMSVIYLNDNLDLDLQDLLLLGNLPALKELSVESLDEINEEVIERISNSCRYLEVLSVRNCAFFNDECVLKLAERSLKLVYLDITHCPQVSPNGMQGLIVAFTTSQPRLACHLTLDVFALENTVGFTLEDLELDAGGAIRIHTRADAVPPLRHKLAKDPNDDADSDMLSADDWTDDFGDDDTDADFEDIFHVQDIFDVDYEMDQDLLDYLE